MNKSLHSNLNLHDPRIRCKRSRSQREIISTISIISIVILHYLHCLKILQLSESFFFERLRKTWSFVLRCGCYCWCVWRHGVPGLEKWKVRFNVDYHEQSLIFSFIQQPFWTFLEYHHSSIWHIMDIQIPKCIYIYIYIYIYW